MLDFPQAILYDKDKKTLSRCFTKGYSTQTLIHTSQPISHFNATMQLSSLSVNASTNHVFEVFHNQRCIVILALLDHDTHAGNLLFDCMSCYIQIWNYIFTSNYTHMLDYIYIWNYILTLNYIRLWNYRHMRLWWAWFVFHQSNTLIGKGGNILKNTEENDHQYSLNNGICVVTKLHCVRMVWNFWSTFQCFQMFWTLRMSYWSALF